MVTDLRNPPIVQEYKFMIPVLPRTVQIGARANFRNKRFYNDPKKLKYFSEILEEIKHLIPAEPLSGMLSVGFVFYLPRPMNRCQSTDGMNGASPAIGRGVPDLVNLIKGLEDGLTKAGLWLDDSQVWRYLPCEKLYCEESLFPRIEIHVQDHGQIQTAQPVKKTRKKKLPTL